MKVNKVQTFSIKKLFFFFSSNFSNDRHMSSRSLFHILTSSISNEHTCCSIRDFCCFFLASIRATSVWLPIVRTAWRSDQCSRCVYRNLRAKSINKSSNSSWSDYKLELKMNFFLTMTPTVFNEMTG